jgi:tetratricopeptide (TPR) repeat protein
MKKLMILSLAALIAAGCSNDNQTTANANLSRPNTNNPAVSSQKIDNSLVVSSHSTEKKTADPATAPKTDGKTKWTQSGSPIDTTAFDALVARAEKDSKAKPADEAAKKALAEAYVNRGKALTDARQYASALGDYRRALKLDPNNGEAKQWIEQIVGIYESINRDYPKEGEEPPPLPFKKEG